MRHFYIFAINPSIKKVSFDHPYDLFHTLETIYYQKEEREMNMLFLKQLICPIAIKELDISIFRHYKDNYFYTKFKNIHKMHDVYRKEDTTLKLYRTYLKLETNVVKPRFLEELAKNRDLFVCDFEEKDYFWLESLSDISLVSSSLF